MKATLLCAFCAVFLAASYVLGAPNYYGGIDGKGGAGKMYDYDGGMSEDGEMMYEYDGGMGGKMANGQGGGMSPVIADGHDELGNSCSCRIGLWCPKGFRRTGKCHWWCLHWACNGWIRCCRT